MNSYVRCSLLLTFVSCCSAQVSVLTGQYDVNRSGANLNETILTPANVNSNQFGLLYTLPVDADIFAQPLYVPGVTVQGAVINVLYVTTLNDSVYAFNADTGSLLWQISLGTPITVGGGGASLPTTGIIGTPVIDPAAQTLYLVSETLENNSSVYRLHGINISTGAEPIPSVVIEGSVPGNGDNSTRQGCPSGISPCIPFVAAEERQRPALLEANGNIYIGFGTYSAFETVVPYHGWLFVYNAATLQQVAVFSSTPTGNASVGQPLCPAVTNPCGHGGGIWMSGRGPAADANGVYVVTGNGGFGSGNWGESVLRLSPGAQELDYFTPSDYQLLNAEDLDLGDAGSILLPNTNLMVATGKTGLIYVLNRSNLGHMVSGDTQVVEALQAGPQCSPSAPAPSKCYEIHIPAYWARSGANPVLYVWGWGDYLRAFDLVGNYLVPDQNPVNTLLAQNDPGGELSVSADGSANGILWAVVAQSSTPPTVGSLYAFNASNITQTLWTTVGNAADGTWLSTIYTSPMVANGKVYVPTSSNQVRVYGLCSPATPCYPGASNSALKTASAK